jgi:hypothetical protein
MRPRANPSAPVLLALSLPLLMAASAPVQAFDHSKFNGLLAKYVKRGQVDYSGIKAAAKAELDQYVGAIAKANVSGLSKNARLAFYLNAYNAIVIKAIVDRLPLASVMKVPGFFKKAQYRVAGKAVTLDQLENKIIRPQFQDARIHFALVCGARSCPPLGSRAFSAGKVDADLNRLTQRFVAGRGVKVDGDQIKISKLFQWYAVDFEKAAGSVGKFLAQYREAEAERLSSAKFGYLKYSWALNGK